MHGQRGFKFNVYRGAEVNGPTGRESIIGAGFGLGRLHHVFSRRHRESIVRTAMDEGFAHFDVAPVYGDGFVERELGRFLAQRRTDVTITTKFGIPFRAIGELPPAIYHGLRAAGKICCRSFGADYNRRDFGPRAAVASLEASLRRLRSEYIDYFLVHEPLALDEFSILADTWEAMEREQAKGKLREFGVSSGTLMLLDAEQQGWVPQSAVRMIPMDDISCTISERWFSGRQVFVFNIVRYLTRGQAKLRMDASVLVDEVVRALPACRPIFATHRLVEIRRLATALAAVAARNKAYGANR